MTKTVEKRIMVFGGVEREVIVTKIFGHAIYQTPRGPIEADEYVEHDHGPKYGVSRSYGIYPQNVPEEEAQKNIRQVQLLAGRILMGH